MEAEEEAVTNAFSVCRTLNFEVLCLKLSGYFLVFLCDQSLSFGSKCEKILKREGHRLVWSSIDVEKTRLTFLSR